MKPSDNAVHGDGGTIVNKHVDRIAARGVKVLAEGVVQLDNNGLLQTLVPAASNARLSTIWSMSTSIF